MKYKRYRNFDETNFLNGLNNINVRIGNENPNECYDFLTNVLSEVANKHANIYKYKKYFR